MDAAFTTDQLAYEMDGIFTLSNAMLVRFLKALDAFDRQRGYLEDGMTTLENWLCYRYGMLRQRARDLIASLRGVRELPSVTAVFEDGRISFDTYLELASFATFDEDDLWANRARRWSASEIRKAAQDARRYHKAQAAQAVAERELRFQWDDRKTLLRFSGRLAAPEGVLFESAIRKIAQSYGPDQTGNYPPVAAQNADALMDLVHQKASESFDAAPAIVVVHVDHRELNKIHGSALLEEGPAVPSEIARRLSCDAKLQFAIDGSDGSPLALGRTVRVATPSQWRELKRRDRGKCVICSGTVGRQAHHLKAFAHGGRTDLDNLVTVCWKCHRKIHDEGFGLVRNGNGQYILVRPDGTPCRRRPHALRPDIKARMLGPPSKPQ